MSERLHHVLQVCRQALERPAAERAAYLDGACAGEEALRRAVDALLAEQSSAAGFLEAPAWTPERSRLPAGTRLGPYEIQSFIGAGGMGEVYKGRDTRLGRIVAIKVLPPDLAADPDRRRRFEQEARAVSALNHPHICTLHDIGSADGTDYLVMEYVDGQPLADRLTKGPIPLPQALEYATQIADALAKAHREGIVHRDVKPGNVMLTKSGVKLLDLGLAKLRAPAAASGVLSSLPTRESSITAQGAIVGTLAYMAPEQLEGKEADPRSDIFSFGALLYEMLTGKRAFEGESHASVIAAILEHEPAAVSSLQPVTPPALDRLVRRCLAKAPDDRPDTAHDVADDVRWLCEASGAGAGTALHPVRRRGLRVTLVLAGLAFAAAIGAGVTSLLRPASIARPSVDVRPADELNTDGGPSATPGGSRTAFTWTPDGQALVFVGRRGGVQQLYVRRLDAVEARPLPNTENAQLPAVSPDGQWVAFWAGGAIKKVPFGGGLAVDLALGIGDPAPVLGNPPFGLVWDALGLFFARRSVGLGRDNGRIWTIPPEGKPAGVTKVSEADLAHTLPSLLPGGRVLLYTVNKRVLTWGDECVVAQPLPTGEPKLLLTDATDARYVSKTGHLVFLRRGTLWAVPFDPEQLALLGQPVPILEGVAQALREGNTNLITGAGQFAVSATGTLAWVPQPVVPYPERNLVTVDRRGRVTALSGPARSYGPALRLSPDGRRLAVTVRDLTEVGLWLYDLTRGTLTRLNRDGESEWPVWAPDGQDLMFTWLKDGRWSLAAQSVDQPAAPRALVRGLSWLSSWHPDRRTLAGVTPNGWDVQIATVEHEKVTGVQPLWQTPEVERWPVFSPDGHWLAYASNKSKRNEVYVQAYPGPGEARQVSLDGGESPAWHRNGREMFFLSLRDATARRRMMAVDFAPGPPLWVGTPHVLFEFDSRSLGLSCTPLRCYDVAPDGQHFYGTTVTPTPPPVVTHINLITNWFEELKAKAPVKR